MRLSLIVLLLFATCVSKAQKLPNKQEVSLRAPLSIKIDGKTNEWDDKFQAYNNATEIFYTIANDDENLYFLIKGDRKIVSRLTAGGIVFSIQDPKKKNRSVSITYPVIKWESGKSLFNFNKLEAISDREADSIMVQNNNALSQNVKFIKVAGIENVDTLISVYNLEKIKAAGLFDRKKSYIGEISIPLKYLSNMIDASQKIAYHIQVNGFKSVVSLTPPTNINADAQTAALINRAYANMTSGNAPTDFWGEYTLAK